MSNTHAVSLPHNPPPLTVMPNSTWRWRNFLFGTHDCITSLQFLCRLSSTHLHRHARTHTPLPPQLWRYPSSRTHSHPQPRNPPLKRKTVFRVRGCHCCEGDLLFSLHYSHLLVALVACRIWQSPSSLYRIRWGNIIHWTQKKKCFSSHRGWCWLEDWTFVSERCVVLGQSLCYGSVSGLRAWLAATAWHVKLSCFT